MQQNFVAVFAHPDMRQSVVLAVILLSFDTFDSSCDSGRSAATELSTCLACFVFVAVGSWQATVQCQLAPRVS